MTRTLLVASLLLPLAVGAEPTTLKLGSLAPRESPWGQVLRVWAKAVKEKSKDTVQLEFFWNGTQGDEAAMISKLKTGQLDGAVVTSVGLGTVHPEVLVLQMPGVFPDWKTLDKVRDALTPDFEKAFRAKGFELVGWGDVGLDHFTSKGYGIRGPADLKGKRPWAWREDPIVPAMLQAVGNVQPHLTGVPEVLPELSVGNIDALSSSALACEQLQWSSRLDHVNTMVNAPNVGGILISTERLAKLPADARAAVLETGKVATRALTDRIRLEDQKALERMKARMTVIEPTPAEREVWRKIFDDARARLARGTFPPELVKKVETLAR